MKLNIITSNEGKYKEYKAKLSDYYDVEMLNVGYDEIQTDNLQDVVDHGLAQLTPYAPLIIDDSGIFIDALNDFPGVYSSYVYHTIGLDGILSLMEGKEGDERKARFECIIGMIDNDGDTHKFHGTTLGEITKEKLGSHGFGYDPIFRPRDSEKTFAEMDSEAKNELSHRGKAVDRLIDFIEENR
ncbi:MAG: RdgB/HAM1 family non-canonical purine NTP pyrophosphatase [Thermoplasmata archaeon]